MPTTGVANLMLNLGPTSAPAPVARDFGASSGQAAQPKADNPAATDRRNNNDTPRPAPASQDAGPDVRQPAPRTRPSDAKTKEPAATNTPARPRTPAAVGEAPARNKQAAAANATSAACSGGVFAQLLQQAAQA
ncbi:MAG: hypothetical protein NT049_10185, partial [Planctomycetota bacterium]|nr:hypothetical protein [Planctomycetota bacterium]